MNFTLFKAIMYGYGVIVQNYNLCLNHVVCVFGGGEEFANGGFNETRGFITCIGKNIRVGGCTSVEKNNVVVEVE